MHSDPGSGIGLSAFAIGAGRGHTCVIVAGGGVMCWGNNGHGQLGIGNTMDQTTPVDVEGINPFLLT